WWKCQPTSRSVPTLGNSPTGRISMCGTPTRVSNTRRNAGRFDQGSVLLEVPFEGEDGARDFTSFHGAEGFVDVRKRPAAGDHLVQLQPTLAVEFEVIRDVLAE